MAGGQDSALTHQPQVSEDRRQAARRRQAEFRARARSDPILKERWLRRHREEQERYRQRQRALYLLPCDTPISTNKYVLSTGRYAPALRRVVGHIYEILKSMNWSGFEPVIRKKSVELAFRNAGYLVKTFARRALRRGRSGGPSRLFAWFLQRIDQVAQQSWAWGCGGRDLVALPVGLGEVRWGRPKSLGVVISGVMAQIGALIGRNPGNKPKWWHPPEWDRWVTFLRVQRKTGTTASSSPTDQLYTSGVRRPEGIHEPIDPVVGSYDAKTQKSAAKTEWESAAELPMTVCFQVLKLYRQGMRHEDIATTLGCTLIQARKGLMAALIAGRNDETLET